MSFEIITKPEKTIEGTSVICNWSAVHNEINFVFARRDIGIDTITDDGLGNVKVTSGGDFTLSDIEAGDNVTLFDDVYKTSATVLSSSPPFEFVLDLPFVSNASGYIILNKRKNYYLRTQVRYFDGLTALFETIGTASTRNDLENNIKVNVAPFLKKKVTMNDGFNYLDLNAGFRDQSGKFSLIVTEFYDNTEQATISEAVVGNFFYLNSAKQIQQKYGSNLGENYLTQVTPSPKAKFLSAFRKPTYFKNFPFALSWVFNNIFILDSFNQYNEFFDINGNSIDANFPELDFAQQGFLNRSTITDALDMSNVSFVKCSLWSITGEFPPVLQLTEEIEVDFDNTCKDSPVFLNWLNTDGSRNFWLFERIQTKSLEVQLNGSFEKYEEDIETSEGSQVDTQRDAKNILIVGGLVPIEKIEGIKTSLYSINVLLLKNPETWQTEGVIWERVRIVPGTFKLYETDQTSAEIQFSIQLNAINNQSQ